MKKIFIILIISILISNCEYFTFMSKKSEGEKTGNDNGVTIYIIGY